MAFSELIFRREILRWRGSSPRDAAARPEEDFEGEIMLESAISWGSDGG